MSAIHPDDYIAFCDGLRRLCGIDLTQYKRAQMERRVRTFLGRAGITRLTDSLDELRRDPAALDALLDRVTINVSQLWRHPEQWARLEDNVLGELAQPGRIRAWSAGCSYGAEAYTLAAVCRQAIPQTIVRVLGTDIDPRVVSRAKEGRFTDEDARTVPEPALERFFERRGEGWRARPELRTMTRFEVGDLTSLEPGSATYDLILCRNTAIYFSPEARDQLHARLAQALRPGGYLVIGPTERVSGAARLGLEPAYPFILRKA